VTGDSPSRDNPSPNDFPSGPERFNPAALEMLRRVGNGTLLGRMIDLFLETVPGRIASARTGAQAGDARAVEFAAHSIKSSAGQLGGTGLQRTAAAVERDAVGGKTDELMAGVDAIGAEFESLRSWLSQVKAGTADGDVGTHP
jgi:two-component system sensor histidine kinase/response regulator